MTPEQLDVIRTRARQYTTAIGPGGEKAWLAGLLAADVPKLLAEVEQLRAELTATRNNRLSRLPQLRQEDAAMTTKFAPPGATLPQYNPDSRCPKCGHDQISTLHYPAGCTKQDCTTCDREHLRRNCQRCKHQWAEAVIDETEAARKAAIQAMAKPGPPIVITSPPAPDPALIEAIREDIAADHKRRPGYSHGAA